MPDLSYRCIRCKTLAPVSQGTPVDASRWPAWRCLDAVACAIRLRALEVTDV